MGKYGVKGFMDYSPSNFNKLDEDGDMMRLQSMDKSSANVMVDEMGMQRRDYS